MSVFLVTMWEEELAASVEKHRIPGLVRLPMDQIGFWPGNRDSTGCGPQHVHEIAEDIVTNGASLRRYGSVDIVKIPAAKLDLYRRYNKTKCDRVDYMPCSTQTWSTSS